MIILGASGESRLFGQASPQSPSPVSFSSPQAAPAQPKIPAPRVYQPRTNTAPNASPTGGAIASPQVGTLWSGGRPFQSVPGKAFAPETWSGEPMPIGPTFGAPAPGLDTSAPGPGGAMPEGPSPFGSPPGEPAPAPGAGAPATAGPPPGAAAPTAGPSLANEAALAGLASEVGAGAAASLTPAMIGDQSPYSLLRAISAPPIPPPFPPPRPAIGAGTRVAKSIAGVVPSVRGLNIADNQSPRPTDRVFSSFNYYDDVNKALNARLGAPIENMIVYRQIYGFEKTFFDQSASIGIRIPIDTLTIQSDRRFGGLGGTATANGNINVFTKLILWENEQGSLLSAGLAVDIPTGPNSFAGFSTIYGKNVTDIQPFLGYNFMNGGDWFLQGFSSIAVPTDPSLPTLMFFDAALGYYVYRNTAPGSFVTAVVPRFEAHLNLPLNHSSISFNDTYGTPTVVNLTFGLNTEFYKRSVLTLGYALPVTGPAPFSGEFILQFNWLFGSGRQRSPITNPPPLTGG
jgi:hypothetical protein